MIVGNKGEFLHSPVQSVLSLKFIQVGAFVLQSVEVPLHRSIVKWASGLAHTLGHMDAFAEVDESL